MAAMRAHIHQPTASIQFNLDHRVSSLLASSSTLAFSWTADYWLRVRDAGATPYVHDDTPLLSRGYILSTPRRKLLERSQEKCLDYYYDAT